LTGETLKLIGLILPLGLDTFGVALALGISGLHAGRRIRLALLFAAFETGMPLVGVALGVPLGHALGTAAEYIASALLIALGLYILLTDDDGGEGDRLVSLTQGGLLGGVALGVSISLDELAIGFSAGLLRLPLVPLVLGIGVQAFIVTLVGLRLGSRVGERWRESAEHLAGAALIVLGGTLLVLRLTS
jgi:putative Mn2+ efflux pump MntP